MLQTELAPIEGVLIQAPDLGHCTEQLSRELAPYNLTFPTEIRRLIDRGSQASSVQRLAKRLLDITGALIGLILLSPVFVALGLLIRLDSNGPVFYSQTRVGRNGRLFKFYKFRSMVIDADALKAQLMSQNEVDGPAFKMKADPRVTRLGLFIRKSSFDELPQLWNVIKGDMSLVGPRPAIPEEVSQWEAWQFQRLSVEQGCTCIWQVSGRSDTNFQQWMRMDLEYVRTWSIALDIALIVRTILVMLTGRGAY
ncbi:MAG: sugar transferase [Chitinophagaceae bacterium]|nr:sugar transferase [Oligoflexus sp.]